MNDWSIIRDVDVNPIPSNLFNDYTCTDNIFLFLTLKLFYNGNEIKFVLSC